MSLDYVRRNKHNASQWSSTSCCGRDPALASQLFDAHYEEVRLRKKRLLRDKVEYRKSTMR